jgi:uncharacterized protein
MTFFHGITTLESNSGGVPITVVRSAVVGLVGAAPIFMQPNVPPPWNPKGNYAVGAKVLDSNMNVQQCTVAGVTGTATPAWATTKNGQTAGDGAVTWQLVQFATQTSASAAPGVGSLNEPVLVGSSSVAGNFGVPTQGYHLSYALDILQEYGGGQAIVVNVFNPWVHNTAVASQQVTLPETGTQVLNIGQMGVFNFTVTNEAASVTYTYGTDYTIDWVNGILSIPNGSAIAAGAVLELNYSYCDPTKVTDATIIGAITAGVYTGMQCFLATFQTMGFFPKILIAPGFSQDQVTAQALDAIAQKIRAMDLIDSAPQTSVSTAIANRGVVNSAFFTSSFRSILCFPQNLIEDTGIVPTGVTLSPSGSPIQATGTGTREMPLSIFEAAVMQANDIENGFWYSPSNQEIEGSAGPDVTMYASFIDPNSDTNNLNAAGIATVLSGFGTGLRTWGNRSAAFPTYTIPQNFIAIRRLLDVVEESIQLASLQFQDRPINNGLIANVLASVNAFIRSLVQQGALISGSSVNYNPGDNPSTQLAAGTIIFEIDLMGPPPAENITYDYVVDTSLLANLGVQQTTSSS